MATPTPGSASKRQLNQSSPAPRSVPSPVTTRHPAGKTPLNHSTTGSSQGSRTLGSTPMMQSLSQTGISSSPSANMLSFGTPSGLGLEGATPMALNLPTPAFAGASMVPTMSELGLTTSGVKRNEDAERRAKVRKVLKRIGKPKGRVSEEGIARVSRRVGFANDIDAEKLTPEERERRVGNRPISTAGNAIVIEIDLKNHEPQSVQVVYSVQSKALDEEAEQAGKVLLDDLRASDGLTLEAKLDSFSGNLERLARTDRLSSSGVNCFEALSGIYTSLRRLYEQEYLAAKNLLGADTQDVEGKADIEVMCKKSGKPLMHAHGKLGFRLAYWKDGRHVRPTNQPSSVEMEIDGSHTGSETTSFQELHDGVFSLRIEAERSSAGLYPSLRVSDAWLPNSLDLTTLGPHQGIPWQEPPPTVQAANIAVDAMPADGQQKFPDLRFVAKLDPPLVVEYNTAMNVLSKVGLPTPTMLAWPPRYADSLLNPVTATPAPPQSSPAFTTTAQQTVLSYEDGRETSVCHAYTLDCGKLDHGFRIEGLPFSHPQQLVELLPSLRQWASVGSFVKAALANDRTCLDGPPNLGEDTQTIGPTNGRLRASELLTDDIKLLHSNTIPVNVTLTTSPMPSFGVAFSRASQDLHVDSVAVQISPNADLVVTSHKSVKLKDNMNTSDGAQRLAKVLDLCGDLGVWVEWMRTEAQ